MTEEEKKEYLNLKTAYQSTPFISELNRRAEYLSKTPKTLFKYRTFDNYTFDMIENNYLYLSPAKNLDDPFDCLTCMDLDEIYKKDSFELSQEMMNYIVDLVISRANSESLDKDKVLKLIEKCTLNGKINYAVLIKELDESLDFSHKQKELLLDVIGNFNNVMNTTIEDENLKLLLELFAKSKDEVGVCSLTTKRDNQPMWSLYANKYKGYCIEYEVPFREDVIPNLCPVIYTKDTNVNVLKRIIQFAMEATIRFASNGNIKTNMGCFTEMLCTKDKDWEYQDEWRIIGNASGKVIDMKIKNIYLGFDVEAQNEDKILELSKVKDYGVYKMNVPKNGRAISYIKLR